MLHPPKKKKKAKEIEFPQLLHEMNSNDNVLLHRRDQFTASTYVHSSFNRGVAVIVFGGRPSGKSRDNDERSVQDRDDRGEVDEEGLGPVLGQSRVLQEGELLQEP